MSLPKEAIPAVPAETARVARKVFRKGHRWISLRDEIADLYDNEAFADLYASNGQPGYAPWRLALISVLQFAEQLSDQQAADAVRSRLEWKYLLALPLDDEGFDASVLSEFRSRLLHSDGGKRMLEILLKRCVERGWLKSGGRQRTDATHVLSVSHNLSRLELVLMTLSHTLEVLAEVAPEWVVNLCPGIWGERYGIRLNEWHLPEKEAARLALAVQAGNDGQLLLSWLWASTQPYEWLKNLPAVTAMRLIWLQQFCDSDGKLKWRSDDDGIPPASIYIRSPYELEARYSEKRGQGWLGYKVHLTESCEEDSPRIITQVTTTQATTTDLAALPIIQAALKASQLLPKCQLVDAGYIEAQSLIDSQSLGIDLFGPPLADTSWQARAGNGFAASDFQLDWLQQQATCPAGEHSVSWLEKKQANGETMVQIKFSRTTCRNCPMLEQCTKSKEQRRSLTVLKQLQWQALQQARERMQIPKQQSLYAARAGSEGTISQLVRRSDLRQARYVGLAKTHLQSLLTAVAINLLRILNWLQGVPIALTRKSRFKQLLAA
jgi:transposase